MVIGYIRVCGTCGGNGNVNCLICNGDGIVEKEGPCSAHSVTWQHYYCTSSSQHGNNVNEYH